LLDSPKQRLTLDSVKDSRSFWRRFLHWVAGVASMIQVVQAVQNGCHPPEHRRAEALRDSSALNRQCPE
jgi:hypothetical protein